MLEGPSTGSPGAVLPQKTQTPCQTYLLNATARNHSHWFILPNPLIWWTNIHWAWPSSSLGLVAMENYRQPHQPTRGHNKPIFCPITWTWKTHTQDILVGLVAVARYWDNYTKHYIHLRVGLAYQSFHTGPKQRLQPPWRKLRQFEGARINACRHSQSVRAILPDVATGHGAPVKHQWCCTFTLFRNSCQKMTSS